MFPLHRRHSIELFNQNTMLNTYRGDLGGKIGWTTASETTFIAWARRGGRHADRDHHALPPCSPR